MTTTKAALAEVNTALQTAGYHNVTLAKQSVRGHGPFFFFVGEGAPWKRTTAYRHGELVDSVDQLTPSEWVQLLKDMLATTQSCIERWPRR